jgi:hypothetical protein
MNNAINRFRKALAGQNQLIKILIGRVIPLVGVIMALLVPPPVASFTNDVFIKLMVTVLVVLFMIVLRLYRSRQYRKAWYRGGLVAAVLFFSAYFYYAWIKDKYILEYEGVSVIVGKEIAPSSVHKVAQLSKESGEDLTDGSKLHNLELLSYAGGFAEKVWSADSIGHITFLVIFFFYCNLTLFLCLMSTTTQSILLTF